jgi:DNA sulfur modification protein DndB
MTNWEKLVSGEQLESVAKFRKAQFIKEKVSRVDVESKEATGWAVVKTYANNAVLMEKEKPVGDAFEDEVWTIFYKMGFTVMNSDRDFHLSYSNDLTKQIDVVAIDDEVCLLIECKATSTTDGSNKTWKTDLEAIKGFKENLFAEVRKKYPNVRCKYIFATKKLCNRRSGSK